MFKLNIPLRVQLSDEVVQSNYLLFVVELRAIVVLDLSVVGGYLQLQMLVLSLQMLIIQLQLLVSFTGIRWMMILASGQVNIQAVELVDLLYFQ